MTAIAVKAVIEEARRRAKHRRLALVGLVALLVVGGGIWAGLALSGGGVAAPGPVPAGFERVAARGPVTYLVLEQRGPEVRTTSLSSGDEAPATVTEQFWYDQRGGLTRKRVL